MGKEARGAVSIMKNAYFKPQLIVPKKWALVIAIILISAFSVFAISGQLTSFKGKTNPFALNLLQNENFTYYLSFPLAAYIRNVSISIYRTDSIFNETCLQETANITECYETLPGNYTHSGEVGGGETQPILWKDEDYSTGTRRGPHLGPDVHLYLNVNYTKSAYNESVYTWQVKTDAYSKNWTLPNNCTNQSIISLQWHGYDTGLGGQIEIGCFSGQHFDYFNTTQGEYLYEEALIRDITNTNVNVNIFLNNEMKTYTHSSDFVPIINNHGQNLGTSDSGTGQRGVNVTFNKDTILHSVSWVAGNTCTMTYIYNVSNKAELAIVPKSTGTTVYDLQVFAGQGVYILCDKQGASYNTYRKDGPSYPYASTDLSYVGNVRNSSAFINENNVYIFNVENITTSNNAISLLNISFNTSKINSILNNGCTCFNCVISGTNCDVPFTFSSAINSSFTTTLTNATYESNLGTCTQYQYPFLNLSYYNEVLGDIITAKLGYNLKINDGIDDFNLSGNYSLAETHSFCTDVNPSERTIDYDVWGNFLIQKDLYAARYIQIQSGSPLTASNNPIKNVSYYLIPLSNSSTVNYNWYTTSYQSITGTLLIYRCEGDGTRILSESTPITDSKAVANLELLNIPYSYEVIVDGVTYTDVSFTTCHIESQQTLTYYVDISKIVIDDFLDIFYADCNVSKPVSDEFLVKWDGSTGYQGCVFVKRAGVDGYVLTDTICATNGTLSGTIPSSGYSYLVESKLYSGDYSKQCDTLSYPGEKEGGNLFGLAAILGIVLLISTLALIWAGDNELMLIGGLIGLVAAWFLGITRFSWVDISLMIAFLLVIAYIGRKLRYS